MRVEIVEGGWGIFGYFDGLFLLGFEGFCWKVVGKRNFVEGIELESGICRQWVGRLHELATNECHTVNNAGLSCQGFQVDFMKDIEMARGQPR